MNVINRRDSIVSFFKVFQKMMKSIVHKFTGSLLIKQDINFYISFDNRN